jgi:hypothetical protein
LFLWVDASMVAVDIGGWLLWLWRVEGKTETLFNLGSEAIQGPQSQAIS